MNKCISNEAILEGYSRAVHGMKTWQKFSDSLSNSSESLMPPDAAVNKNNIPTMEKATLDAYRYHTAGPMYDVMKKSAYWSFLHDGISKFSKEYNGVYLRGIQNG